MPVRDTTATTNQTTAEAGLGESTRLTGRDLEVLRLAGMDGLATLEALHHKFWAGASERTCRDRLRKLEKAGWLSSRYIDTPERRGVLVFTLTPLAVREFAILTGHEPLYREMPDRREIHQQLLAQEARLQLEKTLRARGLTLVEWAGERQLRSEFYRNQSTHLGLRTGYRAATASPTSRDFLELVDARAIITNTATGKSWAVLVEIDGDYWGQRLRQKLTALAQAAQPVVWITPPRRAGRVRAEITKVRAHNIELIVLQS
ncbi:MAG TPA: hypothetical protein VH186_11780 [Chloroflexia bacterium]|nr:hypothetical protein [Chloroflexia bacterium]